MKGLPSRVTLQNIEDYLPDLVSDVIDKSRDVIYHVTFRKHATKPKTQLFVALF